MVAFKEEASEAQWFHSEDRTSLKVRQRLTPTVDGECPLQYFDGSTMSTYRHPSRAREDVFCNSRPIREGCALDHGFEKKQDYLSMVHVACLRHGHNCSSFIKEVDPGVGAWLLEDPRFTVSARQVTEMMKNSTARSQEHVALSEVLNSGAVIPPRSRQGGAFNPFMDRQVKLEFA